MVIAFGTITAIRLRSSAPIARPLGIARAVPQSPSFVDGAWYWVEQLENEALLVRATDARRELVRGRSIPSYAVAGHHLLWADHQPDGFRLSTATPDGSGTRVIRETDARIMGAWTDGAASAWLEQSKRPGSASRVLPPLGARCRVLLQKGDEQSVAAELLEEFETGEVLGFRSGVLYVLGIRAEGLRASVIYRIKPGEPPQRNVGETGVISAVLDRATLYWTAPSRESNSTMTECVRALATDTLKIDTIADWLPGGGRLCLSGTDLLLLSPSENAPWLVDHPHRLGSPLALPPDEYCIGAGEGRLLTVRRQKTPGRVAVSEVLLP